MQWHGNDLSTIGDLVYAILAIDNEQDMSVFFADHVAEIKRQIQAGTWESDLDAIGGARANIGWCYGEGMKLERIAMWKRVTGASHPIFGDTLPRDSVPGSSR